MGDATRELEDLREQLRDAKRELQEMRAQLSATEEERDALRELVDRVPPLDSAFEWRRYKDPKDSSEWAFGFKKDAHIKEEEAESEVLLNVHDRKRACSLHEEKEDHPSRFKHAETLDPFNPTDSQALNGTATHEPAGTYDISLPASSSPLEPQEQSENEGTRMLQNNQHDSRAGCRSELSKRCKQDVVDPHQRPSRLALASLLNKQQGVTVPEAVLSESTNHKFIVATTSDWEDYSNPIQKAKRSISDGPASQHVPITQWNIPSQYEAALQSSTASAADQSQDERPYADVTAYFWRVQSLLHATYILFDIREAFLRNWTFARRAPHPFEYEQKVRIPIQTPVGVSSGFGALWYDFSSMQEKMANCIAFPGRTLYSPKSGSVIVVSLSMTYCSLGNHGRWEYNPELEKLVGKTHEFLYHNPQDNSTFYAGTVAVSSVQKLRESTWRHFGFDGFHANDALLCAVIQAALPRASDIPSPQRQSAPCTKTFATDLSTAA